MSRLSDENERQTQVVRPLATVLLADISGFTALSEKLDPEEVTSLVNASFERLEGIVLAHGGFVDQYLGDCVKAVFGLSPGGADPAAHAVQAAWEMRQELVAINRDRALPSPLGLHVGVATGEVIGGGFAEPTARRLNIAGEPVHRATALEGAAHKGEIFVDRETRDRTEELFNYTPHQAEIPHSDHQPLVAFELSSLRDRHRVARQSERRLATVTFAEVPAFDDLTRGLEPEEASALLEACLGAMTTAIAEHGGFVDKYVGAGLMALFGVPLAIEEAPKQALNAAIEMRQRVQSILANHNGASGDFRAGVNTGLMIAGEIGGRMKRDFTVIGDAVNLAARLMHAAKPGAILIGPETYRYTSTDFEFEEMPPLRLKGKSQPIPARQLTAQTRSVHRESRSTAGRTLSSDMVGREAEATQLRARLVSLASGRGGIVSVVGDAGIGKSRLIAELTALAQASNLRILLGRSLAIGQNLSFHPFVDLLRSWAGISDDDVDTTALAKLETTVATVLPESSDALPFLATLLGLRLPGEVGARLADIDGEALERLIAKSVRDLFEALARRAPVVVILEDLHWADLSSLKLLEFLMRLIDTQPILFVNVFRPDLEETAAQLTRGAAETPGHLLLRLQPLAPEHANLLVQNLLRIDDLPAATRQLITERAEGNPFYIEEVVGSLIDSGAVEFRDGRYRVTEKIADVVIPGTIQEVIMTRVDRLSEPERRLLQIASVIGRSFYFKIVDHIVRLQQNLEMDPEQEMGRLREKQLLLERRTVWTVNVGDRGIAEDLEYIFRHAVAQQTVYESLLLKTRRDLHLTVARAVEALFVERLAEFYGVLAYHYSRAEDLEKAEDYLFRAGQEAARSAASSEALSYFQEAARLYGLRHGDGGDPKRRALLEKNIGLACLNTGRLSECIEQFDLAMVHLGERLPKSGVGMMAKLTVDLASVLGHLYFRPRPGTRPSTDADREYYEVFNARARALATNNPKPKRVFFDNIGAVRRMSGIDPSTLDEGCGLYAVAGGMFSFSGASFPISRRFLDVARRCRAADNVSDDFDCRHLEFTINYLEGHWDRDDLIDEEFVEVCIRHGLFWDVQTYLGLACDRLFHQGEFEAAWRFIARLAELRDAYGYTFAASNHDGELSMLLLEERDLSGALEMAERYYAGRSEDALRVLALGIVAKTRLLRGETAEGQRALAEAEAVHARAEVVVPWHQGPYVIARALCDLNEIEQAKGNGRGSVPSALKRRARRSVRRAVSITGKAASHRTEAYRLVGRYEWLTGRPHRAAAWWARAIAEGERMRAAPEVARIHAEIARRLVNGEGREKTVADLSAPAHAEKARDIFSRLRLERELEETLDLAV